MAPTSARVYSCFADGAGVFPRLLAFYEQGAKFNAFNFSLPYNVSTGANFTASSASLNVLLCPSADRVPQGLGQDSIDPNDALTQAAGHGYGFDDYGPTCYTDIDPLGQIGGDGNIGAVAYPATPYRNKSSLAEGLLSRGMTKLGAVIDGLSNTIMIGEDAGRDARFQSPFTEGYAYVDSGLVGHPPYYSVQGVVVADGYSSYRRFWRWAEADTAFGVSGNPNNGYTPDHSTSEWPAGTQSTTFAGNNASANDELFSYHRGGVNVVMGDGTVRFLSENLNILVLRALLTRNGKEVINDDDWRRTDAAAAIGHLPEPKLGARDAGSSRCNGPSAPGGCTPVSWAKAPTKIAVTKKKPLVRPRGGSHPPRSQIAYSQSIIIHTIDRFSPQGDRGRGSREREEIDLAAVSLTSIRARPNDHPRPKHPSPHQFDKAVDAPLKFVLSLHMHPPRRSFGDWT